MQLTPPTLEQAYRQFFPVVRERCRRLLGNGDEASDVAQETFIRLWRAGECRKPPRDAAAWIHRTALHLAIDRLRGQKARASWAEQLGHRGGQVLDLHEVIHNRQLLAFLAQRLPADVLEAGVLHRADGLSQPDVARVLGCSERTVRRLLTELDERLSRLKEHAS